ncbi:ABC transporter ATP-binding protein [Ancylobacter oerskovii]|uniref:ABC transporter ATP-binding protein n=1 Tax=Ancylobacter oerskovii TaxID=459519 RepID=A0ABW4YTD5_9HYPH
MTETVVPVPGTRAAAPSLLTMNGIGKSFGSFVALAGIDIDFAGGEVHCLLGENGAGKSTLCNLVFGIHRPSEGAMRLKGEAYAPSGPSDALARGIAMVHQHFSLVNELTVIDNLLMGGSRGRLDRKAEARRIEALAEEFGLALAPFATVGDLSVGERQRVEIVKCLMRRPQVLILDEPTAVLLPDEIGSLLTVCRQVADSGCAVVMVTHKLAEIERVADRVTVLHRGRVSARSDRPAEEIPALVSAMIQRPAARSGEAVVGAIALAKRKPAGPRPPAGEAMQLDGVSFDDRTGVRRLDAVTLSIERGEIVGVAGVEGNGQSELGAILAGLARPTDGRWFAGGRDLTQASPREITRSGVGIVPEDRHAVGSIGKLSLADNLFLNRMRQFSRLGLIDRRRQMEKARDYIQRFDVRAAGATVAFGSLSGGNQQKAVLARELTTPNLRFLLAAQPTRGLDIGAIETVYGLIRDAAEEGVGVLLVSSELDELIAVADRIVVFYRGRIAGEYPADPVHREAIGTLMSGRSA